MTPDSPRFPNVGVLAFVPDRWESLWQPRHQILARLAHYFHVVWVTPPTWWRRQIRNVVKNGYGTSFGDVPGPGLAIYQPPSWLPEVGRPAFLARWTAGERLCQARRVLQDRGCTKIVLYIWRPRFADMVDAVAHDMSCYHIDDEYTFSAVEQPLDPIEARLITTVDQVFIHSPALLQKKGHLNPHTVFVPNGVDYEAFATPRSEPADLAAIPRPRIGYVGRVKSQLDLGLLKDLANRHVNWSFVLVGPVEDLRGKNALMHELRQLPNFHLLGAKPVADLPAYTQHLDVCMLCYEVNDYTKFVYPLKLHEYLASGRPIVGSPINSLQEFSNVVQLAHTRDEWSTALTNALSHTASSEAEIARRRAIAREYDWDRLVAQIATILAQRLSDDRVSLADTRPSPTLQI